MAFKLRKRSLFPAIVTATSPLTLLKQGVSYIFGLDIDALRTSLDPYYEPIGSRGGPIVLYADGQSNISLTKTFAWTPNANAFIWNNTQDAVNTGTSFTALSATTIGIAEKFASDVADANPGRLVYLIKNGYVSQPISHWLSGTGAPDMYANGKANVEAALAFLGRTKIDAYLRWQGEADAYPALSTTYVADFATMMTRYFGNTWFPQETPIILCGVGPTAGGFTNFPTMNDMLIGIVNVDPDKRRFLATTSFVGGTYWDALNTPHMTGQGYFSAGALAANLLMNGPGRGTVPGFINDPATGKSVIGNIAQPTAMLTINANTKVQPVAPPSNAAAHAIGADGVFGASYTLDGFGGSAIFVGRRANGTQGTPTGIQSGDILAGYQSQGYIGSGYTGPAGVFTIAAENWAAGTALGTYTVLFNFKPGTAVNGNSHEFRWGSILVNGVTSGSFSQAFPAIAGTSVATWAAGTYNVVGDTLAQTLTSKTLTTPVLTSYTVAALPAGSAGMMAFATNCRMFNGAGTQEGVGSGTGGLVVHNGTAWKIAGTNVTAVA